VATPLWGRFRRTRLWPERGSFTPRISALVPCKGVGPGFAGFLESLEAQRCARVEYIFCLASADDPAIPVIQQTLTRVSYRVRISRRALQMGEKVQNLLAGLEALDGAAEVVVFLDADGRFAPDYLERLVAPLADPAVTCASTYRKYCAGSLGGVVAKYWNAISICAKESAPRPFVWGGGFALRRDDVARLDLPRLWGNVTSDDITLSQRLADEGARVVSVPAYTHSRFDDGLGAALRWIARQSLFPRLHFRRFHHLSNTLPTLLGVAYVALFAASGRWLLLAPLAGFVAMNALLVARFGGWRELLLVPLTSLMLLGVGAWATFAVPLRRSLRWGGIVYHLDGRGRVLARHGG